MEQLRRQGLQASISRKLAAIRATEMVFRRIFRKLGQSDSNWAAIADIVAVLSAIIAGGFAVNEYFENKETKRVENTLALIQIWEDREYGEAYSRLRKAYTQFEATIPTSNSVDVQNLEAQFVSLIEKSDGRSDDVRKVMTFFNRLALCVNGSVCSQETAKLFFDDTISSFLDVYRSYISRHANDFPGRAQSVYDLSLQMNPQPLVR
ncbi:MAG: hypothetical protein QM744_17425 [Mesorhizobium sp.]